jgi:hypothetical protein
MKKFIFVLAIFSFLTPSVFCQSDSITTAIEAILRPNAALRSVEFKPLFNKLNNRTKAVQASLQTQITAEAATRKTGDSTLNAIIRDFGGGVVIRDMGIPQGILTPIVPFVWIRPSFGQISVNEFGKIFYKNNGGNANQTELQNGANERCEAWLADLSRNRNLSIGVPTNAFCRLISMMKESASDIIQTAFPDGDVTTNNEVTYTLMRQVMSDYAKSYDPTHHAAAYNFPLSSYGYWFPTTLYLENVSLKQQGGFFYGANGNREMGILIDDLIQCLDLMHNAANWNAPQVSMPCPALPNDRAAYWASVAALFDRFIAALS